MDVLKNYLEQIKNLVGGLSRSAKLAVALLTVLIAGALVMLVRYGSKPQMVPVYNSVLPDDTLGEAQRILGNEMDVQVVGGKLMVPADKKTAAYSLLAYNQILPSDPVAAFEDLAKQDTMWTTEKQQEFLRKQAKQRVLSDLIRRFPNMRSAQVILEEGTEPGLGRPGTRPTASVSVSLKRGDFLNNKLVASIADLVAGSVRNMTRQDVRVIDATNGRSYRPDADNSAGADLLCQLAERETYFSNLVLEHLRHIPNVIVSVHATPDPTLSQNQYSVEYKPNPIETTILNESDTITGGASGAGGEPGVRSQAYANAAANLPGGGGGGGAGSSEEHRKETVSVLANQDVIQKLMGPEVAKEISASVSIPRQYLVAMFKDLTGQDAKQDDPQFLKLVEDEKTKVRQQVMPILGVKDEKLVQVDWYFDGGAAAPAAVATAGVTAIVSDYGKPAALWGLALVSLFMVMMMVRRRHSSSGEGSSVASLGSLVDQTVGSVDNEPGALPGIELDEDTVRAQRVVEQVAQMVQKNPDTAANLIRRWIQKP